MTCRWCGCKLLPSEAATSAKAKYCEDCHTKKLRAARKWRRSKAGRAWNRVDQAARRDAAHAAGRCEKCPAPHAPDRRLCVAHLEADRVRVATMIARAEGVVA